ncbi:DAHL domain-containing protein [Massilia sp. Root351]|uniref:DAHL domain-containing protein n=1 Tax=Massilia sp. Root351 TaxID=1736522 RepID=UPI0012F6BD4E|nr:DAHL domain-containing protein [Massilia sp. Root351]
MNSRLPLLGGILGVALAGALLFQYRQGPSYDASSYFESVARLRQIKQLDAQWELDAMKSRLGINQSYDELVNPLPMLHALPQQLGADTGALDRPGAQALAGSVAALERELSRKAALIESFKSHNAVLRNSLAFLPVATGELVDLGRSQAPDSAIGRAGAAASKVLLATLVHNQTGADEHLAAIEVELAGLAAARRSLPPELAQRLDLFTLHVHTALREQQAVHGLLARVAAAPTGTHMDQISALLNHGQERDARQMQQHRAGLLLLSAALAALLLYAGWRLIRSHAIINSFNSRLLQANEGLEAAVRERTGELLRANDKLQTEMAERKQLEGRLVQSEKLASIGQLAAGVAHEINNPLGFLASNSDMLEQYLERLFEMLAIYQDAEPAMGAVPGLAPRLQAQRLRLELDYLRDDIPVLLAESRDGMARVSKIVQSLKDFSRTDSLQQWEWADLHRCIDSTLNIIASEVRKVADVRKEYGPLPDVECMPSQLNQVFMNLLVNASHAVGPERGLITIRTGVADGQGWIEVADTGCGIADDVLPRIFDPFFTTKAIGKGTGLGLSLSYGIVQNHRGRIDVESAPGAGSRFRITLPLQQSSQRQSSLQDGQRYAAPASRSASPASAQAAMTCTTLTL